MLAYQYADAMQTKKWKKMLAFLLAFAVVFGSLFGLLSRSAMAQERLEVNDMLTDYTKDIVSTSGVAALDKEAMSDDSNVIAVKNRDGSNTAYIFSEPVTFRDENGTYKAKDISIQKTADKSLRKEGYQFENGINNLHLRFSESPEVGILLSEKNWSYNLIPIGGDDAVVGTPATVMHMDEAIDVFQYPNYYGQGTTLNFYPELNGVKEEIILESVPNSSIFEFQLVTDDATATLCEDGSILIVNSDGIEVQTIRAPYAYDAEYLGDDPDDTTHYSQATFTLSEPTAGDDGLFFYQLEITVDEKWLNVDTTIYPVTIDPTTSNLSNFYDAGVYSAKATTNYGTSETACFGRASEYGYGRVLLAFNLPSDVTSSTTINSAYYWLRETTGRTTTTYVTPYMATNVWLQSTVTWNKKPGYDSSIPQQTKCINGNSSDTSSSKHWYRFNIQSAVNAWKNGTHTNRGLEFISNEETNGAYNWRAFATKEYSTSSYRPYAVVTYTNDTTPPTYTSITGNSTDWTNQNITLKVNGAADSGSGLASEAYSFSNSATTNYWQASNQKTFTSNQTVYIKIRDTLGNIKDCGSVAITKIDKTKPSITNVTGAPAAWTRDSYTLSVTALDSDSGVSAYSFSNANSPSTWQSSPQKTLSEGGTIYVFVKDVAGNISDATVLTNVMCDPDAPVIDSINTSAGTQSGEVNVEIVAHDDGSGIAAYSFDGGTTWQNSNTGNIDVDEFVVAQFAVKDNVGNIAYDAPSDELPMFYMDGQLVGLGTPANGIDGIEYKIGEDGEWTEYTWPFAIPAFATTRVYARLLEEGTVVSKDFTSLSKYYGSYSESNTDFSLNYRGLSYDFVRSYDSGDYGWFFGTDATVKQVTSASYIATLPDGTEEAFIRNGKWSYINQRTEDTLTIEKNDVLEPTGYTVKVDDTNYSYSLEGRLTSISNRYGDEIILSWTKRSNSDTGTVADYSSVDISDGTTTGKRHYIVAINADGQVTSVTDPADNIISYSYDNHGNLAEVVDQAGVTIGTYSYAEIGSSGKFRLTKSLDKNIQYNASGRLTKELWDSGAYTKYIYNDSDLTISTESSNTETTSTTYNDAFFVVSDTDAQGETKTYTYNDLYQVTSESTGSKTTTYTYDEEGNLTKTVDEDGKQTTYSYNGSDQLIKESSEEGTTYYVYYGANENSGVDGDLKLTASLKKSYTGTAPAAYDATLSCFETVSYTYEGGLVSQTIDSLNNETTAYVYDQYGNPTQTSVTKITVDENNNQSSSLTVTTSTYDLFNRTLNTSTATNSSNIETSSTIYDAAGRTLKSDIKGDVTRTRYDSLGRIIQEIGPEDYNSDLDGLPVSDTYSDGTAGATYVYSADHTLASETNRLGKTTNYYYNSSGNKIREEFDIYKFYYRDHGELYQVKVNDATKVTYNYSSSTNLLQSIVYANGDTIYYTYNANNNLVSERRNNESAYVTYSYNNDNELLMKIDYDNGIEYSYGSDGSVTLMRYSDDFVLQDYSESSNEEDVDSEDDIVTSVNEHRYGRSIISAVSNRSSAISVNGVGTANYSFTNNDKNNLASEEVRFNDSANAFSTAYTYDTNDNITEKTVSLSNNTTLSFINTYDSKNRITSSSLGNIDQTYSYDQYGQLTQVVDSANEFTESYTYDSRGNILSKNKVYDNVDTPAETTSFTYGTNAWQDELTEVNGTNLTYDANGNVLTYGTKSFTWKNGRVLAGITDSETNSSISYSYDENGIRLSKTVNGTTTWYTVKDGVILAQTTGGNTMLFQYDNAGNPLGFVRNNTQYFYVTNQMGDVVGITDISGNLIATYSYGAWGEVLTVTPATPGSSTQLAIANDNPLRYRGYYFDAETSYYYLQSRYYDPEICRFVNADIIEYISITKNEISGSNLFAYCYNDAVNGKDANGSFRLKRSTAIYLIDAALTLALPWMNAKMDAEARIVRGLLNVVLKLKRFKKFKQLTSKTWSLVNRLQHGTIPKYKGLFSRFFTTIRKVVWRTTGYLMSTAFKNALNKLANKLINLFSKNRWSQHIGLLTSLLTLAGWTALFLDYFSDWSLNGWIRF